MVGRSGETDSDTAFIEREREFELIGRDREIKASERVRLTGRE